MAVSTDLLGLLRCPETGGALGLGDDALLGQVRGLASGGRLYDRKGSAVTGHIDAVLVREDGSVLYVVRDGIIDLAAHAGVALPLDER